MVHIIKVFFQEPNKEKQIRRIAVNSDIVGKYDLLLWKIRELFPMLENKQIEITWKDPENDIIHMSSDDELAQALANTDDGLLKIYIYVSNDSENKTDEIPKPKSIHNDSHPFVSCDGCDGMITGYRYKCLQCKDFDLCSNCNAADKHPNHDMMKLTKPTHIPREWVFLGARKMWKSMFGHCPSTFYSYHQRQQQGKQQKQDSSPPHPQATNSEYGKSQWHRVVDDLLKGDFVPAEKLLKENLGSFLNFVESVAGGVDVKIENPPFEAGPKKPEASADVKNTSEESAFSSKQSADNLQKKKDLSPDNVAKKTTEKEEDSASSTNNDINETIQLVDSASSTDNDINETIQLVDSASSTNNDIHETIQLVNLDTSVQNLTDATDKKVSKPSAPGGLFSCIDTSVNADGWTLLGAHSSQTEIQESISAVETGDTGAKPKTTAIYPEISETLRSCQTSTEDFISSAPVRETLPKEPIRMTQDYPPIAMSQDPNIVNALLKMQAMGFSNEGGWLERLLITKSGNINEALDSLYPNTRRQ